MTTGFDLNRGATMKKHPRLGMIGMYKDAPGIYYWLTGAEASEQEAIEAGFNVTKHRADRRKIELQAEARKKIEMQVAEELEKDLAEVEGQAVDLGDGPPNEVVRSTGDGEPRETRSRKMDWTGPGKGWVVVVKASGEIVYQGMDRVEALRCLQEGDE